MNDNMTIGAVYPDGTEKRAAARTSVTQKPPCVSFVFSASLSGEAPVSAKLYAGEKEVYSSSVSADSGGLLGADISVALCSETSGAASGAAKLFASLSGTGDATFGLDCEKADGTRVTLDATVTRGDGVLTVNATLPADARLVILTADGEDCAATDAPCENAEIAETVTCTLPSIAHSAQIEESTKEGTFARTLPLLLSDVRTFPALPPASTLRSFGKVLVLYGMGVICAAIDGKPVTVRAAKDVTSVWAAADGTLAYVSGGRARMCRGTADLCETDGDKVVITGTGENAVMHVLGGGKVRGINASGDETYSRTSVAVSICTYVGNVVELRELYTDVYTAAGEFVGSRNIIYTVTAVPYAFDGGFGMVSTAYDNTRALFILTPVVAYKANNDIPAGCDGTLIARTEEDGRTAIYEYDRPSEKTFVGYADSAAFAFTDALYSVGEEGRISRRTALKKRVLYMGDEFTYQSQHPMTGTVRSRDEGEVAFTATGGQV